MKTKFFKTGLPIMAFLMAVGLALGTEQNTSVKEGVVGGYIHSTSGCSWIDTDCENFGATLCKVENVQVFKDSRCSDPMYRLP